MSIDVLGHRILIKPERLEDHDKALRSAKAAGIEATANAQAARIGSHVPARRIRYRLLGVRALVP